MSEPCPHVEAILADDERFARGYYESGRERADLIAAITALRQERDALRATLVLSDHEFKELRADLGQQITVWAAIAQRDEAQDAMRMLKHVLAAVSEMHTITRHVRDRRVTAARGIKQIAACCQFAMQALEQNT